MNFVHNTKKIYVLTCVFALFLSHMTVYSITRQQAVMLSEAVIIVILASYIAREEQEVEPVKDVLPQGSYKKTCDNCEYVPETDTLVCMCNKGFVESCKYCGQDHKIVKMLPSMLSHASKCLFDITDCSGELRCMPDGSYKTACHDCVYTTETDILSCSMCIAAYERYTNLNLEHVSECKSQISLANQGLSCQK